MESLMPPSPWDSRRSPGKQSISARRSTASLRNTEPLDNDGGRHISLAHELAAAMMPESNVTSRMLSEEFGIDFEDGEDEVEGGMPEEALRGDPLQADAFATGERDDPFSPGNGLTPISSSEDLSGVRDTWTSSNANGRSSRAPGPTSPSDPRDEFITTFGVSHHEAESFGLVKPAPKDPLELLAQNLQATDLFIGQLRNVDVEQQSHPSSSNYEPQLEKTAATLIGRLNDVARERETQVRTLQEYDRELRKISAEVGGNDLLGLLDELEWVEDLMDPSEKTKVAQVDEDTFRTPRGPRGGDFVVDTETPSMRQRQHSRGRRSTQDDDDRREQELLGDDYNRFDDNDDNDTYDDDLPSPGKFRGRKTSGFELPPAPRVADVPSPSSTIPHLSYVRSLTQSLVHSLSSLSEHAQVNGVNTTDAGRKLRALRNKVVELKADWDSADRSRIKIERWEAGLIDDLTTTVVEEEAPDLSSSISSSSRETSPGPETPELASGPRLVEPSRRVDGRTLVEEQLRGFENALAEAARKTQLIMASG